MESFCKDLVDVVVQKLGYRAAQVWEAIFHENPLYQPRSRDQDWDEEMSRMTVGSAELVLKSLMPLAWPADMQRVTHFLDLLGKLRPLLNSNAHHSPGEQHDVPADSLPPADQAAGLVDELLKAIHSLMGEMPWHMTATTVYGEQPKVLTGEAWSHSHEITRTIRVIDWTGWTHTVPGRKVVLWNRTGKNPVIADPMFISRPPSDGW